MTHSFLMLTLLSIHLNQPSDDRKAMDWIKNAFDHRIAIHTFELQCVAKSKNFIKSRNETEERTEKVTFVFADGRYYVKSEAKSSIPNRDWNDIICLGCTPDKRIYTYVGEHQNHYSKLVKHRNSTARLYDLRYVGLRDNDVRTSYLPFSDAFDDAAITESPEFDSMFTGPEIAINQRSKKFMDLTRYRFDRNGCLLELDYSCDDYQFSVKSTYDSKINGIYFPKSVTLKKTTHNSHFDETIEFTKRSFNVNVDHFFNEGSIFLKNGDLVAATVDMNGKEVQSHRKYENGVLEKLVVPKRPSPEKIIAPPIVTKRHVSYFWYWVGFSILLSLSICCFLIVLRKRRAMS